MSVVSREALWQELCRAGAAQGTLPAAGTPAPWFVRVMLGVGGWIGAIFLFGFVGLAFELVMRSTSALLVVGALVCTAAALLFRAGRLGDLTGQFALAVSLAGQAMLAGGLLKAFDGSPAVAATAIAAQQAVLFFVVPGSVHRVWTAGTGAFAALMALGELGLAAYSTAALSAACALVLLREFDDSRRAEMARAAGYGVGVAAVLSAVTPGWMDLLWGRGPGHANALHFWGGAAATAAVVLGSAAALLRREGMPLGSPAGKLAMLGALIVAATSAKAPGVAPASLLLVLGYANGNRVLAGSGVLALVAYLGYYYYSLQATLLEKSLLLGAAGIALLLARLALRRAGEGAHA